ALLAASLDIHPEDVEAALGTLESDGVVLRGSFSPEARAGARCEGAERGAGAPASDGAGVWGGAPRDTEWCDRALLARIHRYTLNRLRTEIEAVTPADYMRFLFVWQHV